MNMTDFYNGMRDNEVWQAKRNAYLDYVYETEREKYSPKKEHKALKMEPATNAYNDGVNYEDDEIINRIDKLEGRIDRLYEFLVQRNTCSSKRELFVFAPESAQINAVNNITLTEEQFKELLSKLNE